MKYTCLGYIEDKDFGALMEKEQRDRLLRETSVGP